MNTIDVILSRTSYRGQYKNIKVPRKHLVKIMEAGLSAPSGCNKQSTSFIAVDDMDILSKLNSLNKSLIGKTAPAMICILTKKIIAYGGKCYNIQDYSAAIENMLLVCIELGYESCWVEGYLTDSNEIGKRMAEVLMVPEEYELVCFLPIGVASEEVIIRNRNYTNRFWFNIFNGN